MQNLYTGMLNDPVGHVDPSWHFSGATPVSMSNPLRIALCLARWFGEDVFGSLFNNRFDKSKFCGDISRKCMVNAGLPTDPTDISDSIDDGILQSDSDRLIKAAIGFLKCAGLDTGNFSVKATYDYTSGAKLSCNDKDKEVEYSIPFTVVLTLQPGGKVLKTSTHVRSGQCSGLFDGFPYSKCCRSSPVACASPGKDSGIVVASKGGSGR